MQLQAEVKQCKQDGAEQLRCRIAEHQLELEQLNQQITTLTKTVEVVKAENQTYLKVDLQLVRHAQMLILGKRSNLAANPRNNADREV